jgi:hypothetical protein
MCTYYVERIGERFNLRQTRHKERYEAGNEHPFDLMAVGFPAADMKALVAQHFPDTDVSALPM